MIDKSKGFLWFCGLMGLTIMMHTIVIADEEPTYAERLGWPKGARVVIFHNDDAGLCHEANIAGIRGVEEGLITSWSVMMPCAWVSEIRDYLKEHPNVCSGLHLTFTCEWDKYRWRPTACNDKVPGLLDPDGFMWGNVSDVKNNATGEEYEAELRAQIALAERMGLPISHLDTHMGTVYATEDFLMRYITVGIEKKIPVMIPGGHMTILREENPELAEYADAITLLAGTVWAAGLPVLDDLHTAAYDWKSDQKTDKFIEVIRALKPGVTQIIIHATVQTPNFDQISTSGKVRQGDLNAMLDPKLKSVIEEEGIILTSWREMAERRAKAK